MVRKVLISVLSFICLNFTFADSPLTSTDLTLGYLDNKYVNAAKASNGQITASIINYLAGKNDIAEKIAVINALGWGEFAQSNAEKFNSYILENKVEKKRTADDYLCIAYMQALGNYFDVTEARKIAERAVEKKPKSFTFQIVLALIKAQQYLDNMSQWCQVYTVCNDVRTNKKLKQDMAEASIKGIFDYIDIYKDECK